MSKDQSSYVINGEPVFKWSKIEFGLGKLSLDVIWFLGLSMLHLCSRETQALNMLKVDKKQNKQTNK